MHVGLSIMPDSTCWEGLTNIYILALDLIIYVWVDNRTLKSKDPIGLGRKEKGIKTLEVQLCESPFIQKRKTGILRAVQMFCATSVTSIM